MVMLLNRLYLTFLTAMSNDLHDKLFLELCYNPCDLLDILDS